jgi:hypothetical protein
MTRDLRIFLFILTPGLPIEVAVFRDCADAHARWLEWRSQNPSAHGFVFAGNSRPTASEVAPLLAYWRGYILISESCRWLLPPALEVFDIPVEGLVAADGYKAMSLYLGSQGWGYGESEARSCLQSIKPEIPEQKLGGHQITNTESVNLSNHGSQEEFLRVLPVLSPDDPFTIAKHLPAWALDVPLKRLPLTVRCANVLKNRALAELRDLSLYSREEALSWQNFGRQSVADLAESIIAFVQHGPEQLSKRTDIPDAMELPPLLDCVRFSLTRFGERDRHVWGGRLGLDGPRRTLEDLARDYKLTRERIRQIEVKILRTFAQENVWTSAIAPRLEALFVSKKEPLYVDLLEVDDAWFVGFHRQPNLLKGLLSYFAGSEFYVWEHQGRALLTKIEESTWASLKRQVLAIIQDQIAQTLTLSDIEMIVESSVATSCPELADLLMGEIRPTLHFGTAGGKHEVLTAIGRGVTAEVTAILESSPRPLHFTEVARACEVSLARPINQAHVNNTLASIGALYFGRGTYGLWRHFPLTEDQQREVRIAAEGVVSQESGFRQWHTNELLTKVLNLRPDFARYLDKYLFNVVIESSPLVKSMGRMVWVSKEFENQVPRERIEIQDACIRILREAGRPLGNQDLKDALSKARGMSAFFMLSANKEMARVAPGVWGLVARDFHCSECQREEITEWLYLCLCERQETLHMDYLVPSFFPNSSVPDALTPFMIMNLAQADPRLHVFRGRFIGLSDWHEEPPEDESDDVAESEQLLLL